MVRTPKHPRESPDHRPRPPRPYAKRLRRRTGWVGTAPQGCGDSADAGSEPDAALSALGGGVNRGAASLDKPQRPGRATTRRASASL